LPFPCFGIKLNETVKWNGLFVTKEIHSLDFIAESRKKYFKPHCKVAPNIPNERLGLPAGAKTKTLRGGSWGIQRVKIRCQQKNFLPNLASAFQY